MRRILALIIGVIISTIFIYAQDNEIDKLFIQAAEYSNKGDYVNAIDSWDMFLQKVYEVEGDENEHYLIGLVFKAKDLMKLEDYQKAKTVLLSAKFPQTGVAINLSLDYNKTIGECELKLGKIQDAFLYYKDAYDYLLEYKEFYIDTSDDNRHWCWSDELCSIALEIARLYRQNGEYENAETAIREAFENMRQDSELCWAHQGEGLYFNCFYELMGIYDDVLSIAVEGNYTEYAVAVYDIAVNLSKMHPNLITIINWDSIDYVIVSLLKTDKLKAKTYISEYINLMHTCLDDWYKDGRFESEENYLISKQFEYTKVGHLCQDANDFDAAEEYYRKAKSFLEENNLKKTEDYLNVLDDISYILELKHKSN